MQIPDSFLTPSFLSSSHQTRLGGKVINRLSGKYFILRIFLIRPFIETCYGTLHPNIILQSYSRTDNALFCALLFNSGTEISGIYEFEL